MESKIKKIPTGLPDQNNKVTMTTASAEYLQEGDDCSNGAIQSLHINTEDAGAGTYFVIKTERWAFDSIEELIDVLKDFEKRYGK